MNRIAWIKSQLTQLKQETDANQRLRWGIFLIAAIALFYLSLVLDDVQEKMLTDFSKLTLQKMELVDLEPNSIWRQRVILETQSLDEKETAIWKAESEALIRAQLQSRITDQAKTTDLSTFNMRVGSFQPHGALDDVSVVRLELDAVYTEDKVLDFIDALESSSPLLKMESMSLRIGKKNNRAKMMVLAYVKSMKSSGAQ